MHKMLQDLRVKWAGLYNGVLTYKKVYITVINGQKLKILFVVDQHYYIHLTKVSDFYAEKYKTRPREMKDDENK